MSERKLLISQKKQIKPLSREERFLSAAVGGDYETAPLNAKEQIMKNVVDNGGATPTGTIEITENGEHDVSGYAVADVSVSGGTSDYTTATVTITNNTTKQVWFSIPVAIDAEGGSISLGYHSVDSEETITLSCILYKGLCGGVIDVKEALSVGNLSTSGDVSVLVDMNVSITGNGTITITEVTPE